MPFFSTAGATGRTTSARSVISEARTSSGHEEGNLFEGFAHGGGLVEVAHVDATDDQSLELTGGGSLDHLLGVEATGGKLAPTQGLRAGLVKATAEGKQTREEAGLDGGAVTARRGTHARRAPVRSARATTADSRPGVCAARSPTRMMPPEQGLGEVGVGTACCDRVDDAGLGAGGGVQEAWAFILREPAEVKGATVATFRPDLRVALAQAQEHGAALVLGLEGDQQDLAGALQVART